MHQDREYRQYVNTRDKLLQELDEIRLELSRKMRNLSPMEQIKALKQMTKGG